MYLKYDIIRKKRGDIMTIGENIKKTRKQANLTQRQLAEKLAVSQAMIAQYESGERNPKRETVEKIAKALGVDPFSLYSFDMATAALSDNIDQKEHGLLTNYRKLNTSGQDKVLEYVSDLADNPKYNNAASEKSITSAQKTLTNSC